MSDDFEPDIERRMKIKPPVPMRKDFEGHLTQTQMDEFDERDRPIMLAMSQLSQKLDWIYEEYLRFVIQAREAEAASIQRTNIARNVTKGLLSAATGAILYAAAEKLFHL